MLDAVFHQALALSLTGGGLCLLVQLTRLWTEGRCSARWQFGLRLAVLGAFLLPVGAVLSALPGPEASAPAVQAAPAAASLPALSAVAAASAPLPAGWLGNLRPLLPLVWLAGLAAVLLWTLLAQLRFQSRLRRVRRPVEDPLALEALRRAGGGLGRLPALYAVPGLSTPMGAGLFRPAVYLPDLPLEGRDLELVLAHELAHFRRRDLWWQWLARLACALHWWHPLVWLLRGELAQLSELACDEAVTAGMSPAQRRQYGAALLDVLFRAAQGASGVCAPFCSSAAGLRRRLLRLAAPQGRPRPGLAVLAGLLIAALLPLSGPLHAWAAPNLSAGMGTLSDYRAWTARHNEPYRALGVDYDPVRNTFSYHGQRLTLFLDPRPMSPEEQARYPWCQTAYECSFRDPDWPNGPCLRTLRGADGALTGVEPIPPGEAAVFLGRSLDDRPVTYHSYYIDGARLYASDPALSSLPAPVLDAALALPAGSWTALREPEAGGETGYLCYSGGQYPWKLDLTGGTLSVSLYPVEGSDPALPTVIRYASAVPIGEITLTVEGFPAA